MGESHIDIIITNIEKFKESIISSPITLLTRSVLKRNFRLVYIDILDTLCFIVCTSKPKKGNE